MVTTFMKKNIMQFINLSEKCSFKKMLPKQECPYLKYLNSFGIQPDFTYPVDLVSALTGIKESWAYRNKITEGDKMHDNWFKGETTTQKSDSPMTFRISKCGEPHEIKFKNKNVNKVINAVAFGEVVKREKNHTVRKFNGELYCFIYNMNEPGIYSNMNYIISINKNEREYIECAHIKLIMKYIKNGKLSRDIIPENM